MSLHEESQGINERCAHADANSEDAVPCEIRREGGSNGKRL